MKKIISTDAAPAAIGPYSQAILVNETLYVSGQVPLIPETMTVIDGGITEQTTQVLKNIENILIEAGFKFKDVVSATVLLSDMENFKAMNEVYMKCFPKNPPARAAYAVKELPLGVLIEIQVIAEK